MTSARSTAIAIGIALVASTGLSTPCALSQSPGSQSAALRVDEITGVKRYDRRPVRYQPAPVVVHPTRYRGFADPSFGPDGRPYPVPEYLRNQCYIDMGYGRFQSCVNR